MTMLTSGMTSSDSREWETPGKLLDPLTEIYDFTLDGAASHINAKFARYCTKDGTFLRTSQTALTVGYEQLSALDGLEFPWRDERVFLNPPWGDPIHPCAPRAKLDHRESCKARGSHELVYVPGIEDFMRKVRNEVLRNHALVVAIIPARMDTNWMHDYVLPYARVTWKRGRVKFIDPTGQERDAPPVGVGIAVYR